jgi:hypothetical protein
LARPASSPVAHFEKTPWLTELCRLPDGIYFPVPLS